MMVKSFVHWRKNKMRFILSVLAVCVALSLEPLQSDETNAAAAEKIVTDDISRFKIELPEPVSKEKEKESDALYRKGLAIQKQKKINQAITLWESALKINPRNAACLNHYAWFVGVEDEGEFKDLEKGLKLGLKAAMATQWNNRDIIDTVGHIYYRMGRVEKAIAVEKLGLKKGLAGNSGTGFIRQKVKMFSRALEKKNTKSNPGEKSK